MESLKISLCITILNEEKTIKRLLDSIVIQTKKPNEIIIVDGGSSDKTVEIIKSFENKLNNLKVIIFRNSSISKGRNLAVKNSKNEIIVMTDAGCILDKHWLKRISDPLLKNDADVVAGFYKMTGNSNFQNSLKKYLGILPANFDDNFLPSARSIAFKKTVWEEIGGFDEKFDRAGEDTDFNIKILENKFKIKRIKNAIVYWEVPNNINDAARKFFYYARGDVQSKKLSKHNLKVLTIFARYLLFLILFLTNKTAFLLIVFVYLYYSYWKAGLQGIIIQIVSDFAVMTGFLAGIKWVIQKKL